MNCLSFANAELDRPDSCWAYGQTVAIPSASIGLALSSRWQVNGKQVWQQLECCSRSTQSKFALFILSDCNCIEPHSSCHVATYESFIGHFFPQQKPHERKQMHSTVWFHFSDLSQCYGNVITFDMHQLIKPWRRSQDLSFLFIQGLKRKKNMSTQ